LVLVFHAAGRRFGRSAARLLAGALLLVCASGELGLVFGLVALQPLLRTPLDLRLRLGVQCIYYT
jgi:hypothetical protein